MQIKIVGIDLGKTSFHLVACNQAGRPVARHKFNRRQLAQFMATLPRCLIGMESCPGSQHFARAFQEHGHDVRLIAPQFIKPYLKGQKNDFNDAEAIAEAVDRPTMRFVAVKTNDQLDLQAVHRVRTRLVSERTAVINQMRGFMIEYGLAVKAGRAALRREIPGILENADNGLSPRMRQLIAQQCEHWNALEVKIAEVTREIEAIAKDHEDCRRLVTVPGIGPLVATALVAAVGNGAMFSKGRDLAAWLGLVPRQHSTGGKPTLLGISKRGNRYVRILLIHGARSCLQHLKRGQHQIGSWMTQLEKRVHKNKVAVALANKMARIAWAILARREVYRSGSVVMQ
jgi:transposase